MKTLLLIDANSLIHRTFHALPPLTTPDNQPIGAIYGLAKILLKILRDQSPDYIAACFDRPEPTFRKEIFKEYKAHRPPAPQELVSQIIKAHELFEKFNIPVFEKAGYEADDVIGTLVRIFKNENNLKIIILTGDLDTLQLVNNDCVIVKTFKKGVSDIVTYNEEAVIKRYGLKPSQLPDYKGLIGDASDNIPGVKGVGPKTAEKILKDYSNLETFFEYLERKKEDNLAKKFLPFKDIALFSKKLATIEPNVPFQNLSLETLSFKELNQKEIIEYFNQLGFQSLINTLNKSKKLSKNENNSKKQAIQRELFSLKKPTENFIIFTKANEILKKRNEVNSSKIKIAYDWHKLIKKLNQKIKIKEPIFDIKIASWLIDPDQKDLSLKNLSKRFLNKEITQENEQILEELYFFTNKTINEYGLKYVFEKIEMPLIPILVNMEKNGIKVNLDKLKKLNKETEKELKELTGKIYQLAGEVFNINSPKQISRILFQKLGIKPSKFQKTEKGIYSTSEKNLFELKDKHPIINLILNYRETFKIKSTYIKPLQEMINKDGRIRTNFIQTGTATGRLSSEKPNLQNIPQSSKWAQPLRDIFEATYKANFLSFDYSQLELRILAHETNDSELKKTFWQNQDIHQLTAAQIFNIPYEKVTPDIRSLGKTLNFGIIYGMGPKALATTSGLTKTEAEAFIKEYFSKFPSIKEWQEKIKTEAQTMGFVKNANGRRRWFLNIVANNSKIQAEAERAAINMPIQSLEADIIKLAMIKTADLIYKKRWQKKIKLLLSIHDELLFEVDNVILNEAAVALKKIMEKVYPLSVPLKVEVKYGPTWGSLNQYLKK